MSRSTRRALSFLPAAALTALLADLPAQPPTTALHWSTYLGGVDFDGAAAVRYGPGGLVTVAGTRRLNGNADAFVARFDPRLPPAQQQQWVVAFGGTGFELVYDAIVDAAGVTTLVGVTESPNLPTPSGFNTTINGIADGFIARVDANGVLVYGSYLGGSSDDRLCTVALASNGDLLVAGVTESANLPATTGRWLSTYQGGTTDAFVARIDPAAAATQQLQWATYFGGPGQDGNPWWNFASSGGLGVFWEGNQKKQLVAVQPNGTIVAATVVNPPYPLQTTAGCFQPGGGGLSDAYLVQLDASGTTLQYGTFFGGNARDFPFAIALHPAGGVLLAGNTASSNLPVSAGAFQTANQFGVYGPTDAFLTWLDPSRPTAQQLVYSTYFGGNGGEDLFLSLAVEPSGLVTIAGSGVDGGTDKVPTTPGCHLPGSPNLNLCGVLARFRLANQGQADLVYGTLLGGGAWTVMHGVAVDEVGDAFVGGTTEDWGYPTTPNAWQPVMVGPREVCLTHMPLLPGLSQRRWPNLATPACSAGLYGATHSGPAVMNSHFEITATNGPPNGIGLLAFDVTTNLPAPVAVPALGIHVLVGLDVLVVATSDALGYARFPLPIPPGTPTALQIRNQWAFLTNAVCPGTGQFATSERLEWTTF